MPTGTRSNINANRLTKPRMATALLLKWASWNWASFDRLDLILAAHQLVMENQPIGPYREQENRRYVAKPRHQEKWPDRQPQIEGKDVVGIGAPHLVEQRVGLHCHHEQQ